MKIRFRKSKFMAGRGKWRRHKKSALEKFSKALQSGGYLLSHNIPQCSPIGDAVSLCCPRPSAAPLRSAVSRLCPLRCSPLSPPRPRAAGAHSPHPTPSATADTARASEAGLAMSNAG